MNDGDYEWVLRSIRGFGDKLFDGMRVNPWRYINGGFQILNKSHKDFFEAMKKYYKENTIQMLTEILHGILLKDGLEHEQIKT